LEIVSHNGLDTEVYDLPQLTTPLLLHKYIMAFGRSRTFQKHQPTIERNSHLDCCVQWCCLSCVDWWCSYYLVTACGLSTDYRKALGCDWRWGLYV